MRSDMAKFEFYEGNKIKTILMPNLGEEDVKPVFVTHDESTFYANDGKNYIWLMDAKISCQRRVQGSQS